MGEANTDYVDPFAGKTPQQIYDLLVKPELSNGTLPRWPAPQGQQTFTGTYGPPLVRSALGFIEEMERDGAFVPNWKGLDYGAGFGRFATMMLTRGSADQLDLVDAWQFSLNILEQGGFKNRRWQVAELLTDKDLVAGSYDFVMSFSVFTHLSEMATHHNLERLFDALKPGGKMYVTVRHSEFIPVKYADIAPSVEKELAEKGIWFKGTPGDLGANKVFGDTIVTPAFMEALGSKLGPVKKLGAPLGYQHIWAIHKLA